MPPFTAALLLAREGCDADASWASLPERFESVALDVMVVMPNHVHGVVWLALTEDDGSRRVDLGEVVRTWKAISTRTIRQSCAPSFGWQRNYYEHVIRSEAELTRVREYIVNNPLQWQLDADNPVNWSR